MSTRILIADDHPVVREGLIAMIRREFDFKVVGEASNNIRKHYPQFVRQHPEVPFGFAYGMRNALAHGYFKVDFELVWKTIHNDLPGLYENVSQLLGPVTK